MNLHSFPITYIVIVNWNGWRDTLICLESLFRAEYPAFKVIVCDNDSRDDSFLHIKTWADGMLDAPVESGHPLRDYIVPPVRKPVDFTEYDKQHAERGGNIEDNRSRLILIQTGANLGFAGGNNVALRYALSRGDFDFIWLLNNDTIIKPDALTHLIDRMKADPAIGICGSTLLYYDKPDIVQACGGGTYNKWFGYSTHMGAQMSFKTIDADSVEPKTDYIVGASMLVSRAFLNNIGLMSEDYFLYFEDIEWSSRARGHYKLAYASKSIVYHKEGGSSGAGSNQKQKSLLSDYYAVRSRLLYTRKFFPLALPTVYVGLLVSIINRIIRGQFQRVVMIIKLAFTYHRQNKLPGTERLTIGK